MKRRLSGIALIFALVALLGTPAAAVQPPEALLSISQSPDSVRRGGTLHVELSVQCSSLSAFVLFVEYDSGDIEQANAEFSAEFDRDYTYVSQQDGQIAVVYTAKRGGAAPQDGHIDFSFRTRTDALSDTVPLRFTVTDAADTNATPLLDTPEVLETETAFMANPSSDSALVSLVPPAGTLVPAFDPEIFDYTLDVPFSSVSLVFEATPVEGATVHVNRKNLGAGGSTVDFTFTVTAADGETKSVYTVAVTRLEKNASGSTGTDSDGNRKGSADKENSAEKADSTTETKTDLGANTTDTVRETTTGAVQGQVYTDGRENQILTVGLTLLSVGFGAVLAVLLMRVLPVSKAKEKSDDKNDSPK